METTSPVTMLEVVREDAALQVTAEAAAHAVLRLVADMPGQMGRMRCARIVGGYPVSAQDELHAHRLESYSVDVPWPLKENLALVDALLGGGLMAQTVGPRPTLVLSRAGHRELEALEAMDGR